MPQSPSRDDDRVSDTPAHPGAEVVRIWLVVGTLAFSAILIAWLVAALTIRGGLATLDLGLVELLHSSTSPRDPVGSPNFEGIMRDISALGSNTLLFAATLLGAALLISLRRSGAAAFLITSATGALLLNSLIKMLFVRARPDFVSVTVTTDTTSFPSSHAMLAAVVLLTIAAIAARELTSRVSIALLMGGAFVVVTLVGLSRVYLGVHWPSDVLTGWVVGSAWVLGALKLAETPRPPE